MMGDSCGVGGSWNGMEWNVDENDITGVFGILCENEN